MHNIILMFRLAFYFPLILSTGLLLSEKDEGIISRIMVAGKIVIRQINELITFLKILYI